MRTPTATRQTAVMATLVGLCAVAGAGCTRSRPVTVPPPIVLNVPPAPPRVISLPPEQIAPTEATTTERPAPVTRPSRPRNGGNRADRGTDAGRPDAAPVNPADTAPPAADATPAATAPVLRTPQMADESEAERRTRDVLFRAGTMLGRVDTSTLSKEARQQHDTAKRFIEQAEQAVLERNFVFASYLADKAETLAKGLSR